MGPKNANCFEDFLKNGEGIQHAMNEAVACATWENGEVAVRHVTSEEMRRCEATLGIERPPYD